MTASFRFMTGVLIGLMVLFVGMSTPAQEKRVGVEFEVKYTDRYMFRGTDVLRDHPALQGFIEATVYDVLDPGDLITGIWGSTDTEGDIRADNFDELRYYTRLENISENRMVRFYAGLTYYDRKGNHDLFDDKDNLDFYEGSLGAQLLKMYFQPELTVYYDRHVSSGGPEDGVYVGLTGKYDLPLSRFVGKWGPESAAFSVTGWYQDGVFGFEPGASIESSVEFPVDVWKLEVRPGLHYSHLFDDPTQSGVSDDDDEWWFSVAATYRFGKRGKTSETPDPFAVRAEDLYKGLEPPK